MRRSEICETAARLIGGERAEKHGDAAVNFGAIAELWSGYFRAKGYDHDLVDRVDVGRLLALMKIARSLYGSYNPDDYVDAVGYLALTGEFDAGAEQ